MRPATPKLNLLKMKKQHTEQIQQRRIDIQSLAQVDIIPKMPEKRGTAILQPLNKLPVVQSILEKEEEKPKVVKRKKKKLVLASRVEKETIEPRQEEEDQELLERADDVSESEFEEQTPGILANFQERFEEIIENEEVSDAIELNEKFMAEHLGVPANELSRLTKIELRVDTSCHNLQVTGEILSGLESLRMSDSIIKCFRDLGTSFRFVRFLYLQRCEL